MAIQRQVFDAAMKIHSENEALRIAREDLAAETQPEPVKEGEKLKETDDEKPGISSYFIRLFFQMK